MLEQAKSFFFPLRKAFEIQIKMIEDTDKKKTKTIENAAENQTKALETLNRDHQLKSIVYLYSKCFFLAVEARDELDKIIKIKQEINKHDLIYKSR